MSSRRFLLLLAAVLLTALAAAAMAASQLKIVAEPGVTEVQLESVHVRIETTEPVIVYLTVHGDVVMGEVEPAEGVRASTVKITVLGDPDQVIFEGRITAPITLSEVLFTQETGRGEQ